MTPFRLLVGHSKGALQINNAIQSLPAERTQGLRVVTLGCPIGENVAGVDYHQYLGLFDALGQLNAWGHWPDHWPPTWHSTNPVLPPHMAAGEMTSSQCATEAERGRAHVFAVRSLNDCVEYSQETCIAHARSGVWGSDRRSIPAQTSATTPRRPHPLLRHLPPARALTSEGER